MELSSNNRKPKSEKGIKNDTSSITRTTEQTLWLPIGTGQDNGRAWNRYHQQDQKSPVRR